MSCLRHLSRLYLRHHGAVCSIGWTDCLPPSRGKAMLHARETVWIARNGVDLLLPFVPVASHASHVGAHPSLLLVRATSVRSHPPATFELGSVIRSRLASTFPWFPTNPLRNQLAPHSTTRVPWIRASLPTCVDPWFGPSTPSRSGRFPFEILPDLDRYESGERIDTKGAMVVVESVGDVRRWRRWSASWTV